MNSRKISFSFIRLAVLSLFFAFPACDIIDEGKYEENGGGTPPIDNTGKPKILLEDFTGIKCPNCPDGAEVYHDLQAQYPNQIIVVGIHGGTFGRPDASGDYINDLRLYPDGERLIMDYKAEVVGMPCALISRRAYNGETTMLRGRWAEAVAGYWETYATSPLKITLNSSVDTTTNKLTADVQLDYITASSTKNLVSVWILEDGIIGNQKSMSGNIPNYEHNNVLRYSFNGSYGEDVSATTPIPADYKWNKSYSFDLPAGDLAPGKQMNPNNLRIVAFVYDADSGVVRQAEETKVTVK